MDKFIIEGGNKLQGRVKISGSKNAALPIIAAAILTDEELILKNIPDLKDITTMINLLKELGCFAKKENGTLYIRCKNIKSSKAPYELVKTMRASILVLGPLLARTGVAYVSMPGGCAIGVRPINLHLKALEIMGANINIDKGYIVAQSKKLTGGEIYFDTPTVTGTENILMAAATAGGKTVIKNAAKEPEIVDLANILNNMGANIEGAGTSTIIVNGVKKLGGIEYSVMNDRIEAGTFMCAALITSSFIEIENAPVYAMDAIVDKFREAGGIVEQKGDNLIIAGGKIIKPVNIKTSVYPGFPTDMQAQFISVLSLAEGVSIVKETIFENRFQHVAELNRMNADIVVSNNQAVINGVETLIGATVMATDLRASASLVIAALAAEGVTEILRIYHLDRGYENMETKLANLGAKIRRIKA